MNIVVLVKPVFDLNVSLQYPAEILGKTQRQIIINPVDLDAIYYAMKLKEMYGGTVTTVSMAPQNTKKILRKLYGYGVDKVIHVSDSKFKGADTYATSLILSKVIHSLKQTDIVITGVRSLDGGTGQVGSSVAEHLNWAQLSGVLGIPKIDNDRIIYLQQLNNITYKVSCPLPAVIIYENNDTIKAPLISIKEICTKEKRQIEEITSMTLEIDDENFGTNNSKTKVVGTQRCESNSERKNCQTSAEFVWLNVIDKGRRNGRNL